MTNEQLERFKRYGIPIDDGLIRLAQIGEENKAKMQAAAERREAERIEKNAIETNENKVVADFWVIDKEKGLQYLGSGKSSSAENKIAHNLTPKEINAAKTYLKNMQKGKENISDNIKIINDRFVDLKIQSEENQNSIINIMCNLSSSSGFEYGTHIAIIFAENIATLTFGDGGLSTSKSKTTVKISDLQGNNRISIATAHTHLDDCDLSTTSTVYGENDKFRIERFGKPYVVINAQDPNCRKVGYIGNYGYTSEDVTDILKFVLSTYKER